jgi:pimeloyl-ACP methyl ester carboxylesterase
MSDVERPQISAREQTTLSNSRLSLYKSEGGYKALRAWYDSFVDTFEFPFESQYVDTRFGRTHMLTAGPKGAEPTVLVQAIAGSAPLWYRQIPALAHQYRVYALDTPGQPGRSDPNPPSLLDNGYTLWLPDVLDALEVDSAHFAGVSSGGRYVMRLAIAAPSRVCSIVMLSPTGLVNARFPIRIWFNNVLSKKKDADTLEDELSTRSFLPASASRGFDRHLARAMALATRHFRLGKSLDLYNEEKGRIKIWQSMRVLRTLFFAETRRSLKGLKTPGLVILGERDMLYNSHRLTRRIQRSMPTIHVEIIPGTGHSATYDEPERVNGLILRFLQSRSKMTP